MATAYGLASYFTFGSATAAGNISQHTAKNLITTNSTIGATGIFGENILKNLGGEPQVYFTTSLGGRYIDQLANGITHESKVGYTTLTSSIRTQIAKDIELINTARIDSANWHFFTSPQTGLSGPSQPLLKYLQQNNINITIH